MVVSTTGVAPRFCRGAWIRFDTPVRRALRVDFFALFFVGLATARFTVFLRIVARLLPTFDFVVRLFPLATAIPRVNLDVLAEE
jgi:hypothetical protein